MDTLSTLFWLSIAVLLYRLFMSALRWKGDVKAGASVGQSSFYVEIKEPKRGKDATKQ